MIVGYIIRWSEFAPYFTDFRLKEIISTIIWLLGMGFLFSLVSQLGFFAYLTVHRFGLGIFKTASLWNSVQVVLIIFGLFDIVYWRYAKFAKPGESLLPYLVPTIIILCAALVSAWIKKKETNSGAFIPALFVMTVVTIVEWVPAIKENSPKWLYLMLFALLACNAYQLLILHKLNAASALERQKRLEKAKSTTAPVKVKENKKTAKKPSV